MDIVKPQQIKVSMTGKQYFCYLMDLKKRGDKYTFNLCIENNISNYIIEKKEVNIVFPNFSEKYNYLTFNTFRKIITIYFHFIKSRKNKFKLSD